MGCIVFYVLHYKKKDILNEPNTEIKCLQLRYLTEWTIIRYCRFPSELWTPDYIHATTNAIVKCLLQCHDISWL